MRPSYFLVLLLFFTACNKPVKQLGDYPIKAVELNNVHLTDRFWLPKIRTIQNITIGYALEKCSEEGRMENFLIAGGIMEGETRGQMPFDDTDLYKIIEGASYSLISARDPKLDAYLDSLIAIIAAGQEEDGYLTTWKTIDPQKSPANWAPPGDRWENLATSHELYNSGHMFEAAVAHHIATGKRNFLDIALKNADLLTETFGPDKNVEMPGHQIVETGLIKLFQVSGERKYLELAKHFLDHRGDSTLRKLYGAYNQDHMPVTLQDEAVGHAVRAIYMYAGMTDIAAIFRDSSYLRAINKLWANMTGRKLYITGGIGARHEGEAFGENYELPNLTAYSETCAAIGSVYWNHRLFLLTGDVKYYDLLERTLYNAVITGISYDGDKFFYPNPLAADGSYAFNRGSCTRQSWFDCSCCPTNLIRFIPYVPNLIYATDQDTLYINLFMSNRALIDLNGKNIEVEQITNYPWDGKVSVRINAKDTGRFFLKVRIPGWARNEVTPGGLYHYADKSSDAATLMINGIDINYNSYGGYMIIEREMNAENTLEIQFPMKVRSVFADNRIEENRNKQAIEYGPLVYCAEEIDNPLLINTVEVKYSPDVNVNFAGDLLGGINTLKIRDNTPGANTGLILIPYYAWSNRGVGKMNVWLPVANGN
jgi:hypothetical protein